MPESADLASAISDLDDGYLQAQLLLAVGRASREAPQRAGFWHALAGLLAAEQQLRRQGAQLGGQGEDRPGDMGATLDEVREELRRDAETLDAQYADAAGEFPSPAGQAPLVDSSDSGGPPAE
jgi:hypothetical protein